jgi:hypothetical protein
VPLCNPPAALSSQLAGAVAAIILTGFTFVGIILTAERWELRKPPAGTPTVAPAAVQPVMKPPSATRRAVPKGPLSKEPIAAVKGSETGPMPHEAPQFLDTKSHPAGEQPPKLPGPQRTAPPPGEFDDTEPPPSAGGLSQPVAL